MNTTLQPIQHKDIYTREVEREVNAWFREAIFAPIQIVLNDAGVPMDPRYQAIKFDEAGRVNAATGSLEQALQDGRVYYSDGVFSGRFSAAITRELRGIGARFDAASRTFTIAQDQIPMEIRGILAVSAQRSADVGKGVLEVLRQIETNIATAQVGLQMARVLDRITADLGKQLLTTTAAMGPADIALTPQIDAGVRQAISDGFTNNLDLSIKKFAQERIPELRRRVEENAFKFGGRTDRLAKIIEAEYGVTQRKAEFLADQETGLLVSKYRAAKYGELGIKEYTWSTSHDARVRPTHRRLEGKRFSFAVGALVTEPGQPARYCNPGEDYRCRCVPRPIVNLDELAA